MHLTPRPPVDKQQIIRTVRLLGLGHDQHVTELRVLGLPRDGKASGYYDAEHVDDLAEAAAKYSGTASGIYVTLNPVTPALLARANNRLIERPKSTTADCDILRRYWLPIDLDPRRPSGISSSDAEHDAALSMARKVRDALTAQGWPQPIVADSGNGAHLLYRVDLRNDDPARRLVQAALEALATQFADEHVDIDRAVFNAARIWRLYGTLARKGDSTPDRPHRMARLVDVPETLEIVDYERLTELAAGKVDGGSALTKPSANGAGLDLRAWLAKHKIEVGRAKPWLGGTLYELQRCPWSDAHEDGAHVQQSAHGAISAGCFHVTCAGKSWHDLRAIYEPESRVPKGSQIAPVVVRMADVEPRRVAWLWPGRFPLGRLSMLVGVPGAGKSLLTICMAAHVSTGTRWPDGSSCPRGSVVLISAEDDPGDTIRPRLDAHYADVGRVHLLSAVSFGGSEPTERMISLADVEVIAQAVEQIGDVRLLIVDPIGSYLGGGVDASRDNEVRSVLAPIGRLAGKYGFAGLVVAHRRKSTAAAADDLALGSRAFVGISRAVWHLSRDPADRARRLLLAGKNNLGAEGSGLAFTIGGDPPRLSWEPDPVELSADEGLAAESAAHGASRSRVLEVVQRMGGECSGRELAKSVRGLRDTQAAEDALGDLVAAGLGRWETQAGKGRPSYRFVLTQPPPDFRRHPVGESQSVGESTLNTEENETFADKSTFADTPSAEVNARVRIVL